MGINYIKKYDLHRFEYNPFDKKDSRRIKLPFKHYFNDFHVNSPLYNLLAGQSFEMTEYQSIKFQELCSLFQIFETQLFRVIYE